MTAAAVVCFVWRERLAGERAANWMALCAMVFALAAPAAVWAHPRLTLDQAAVTTARFWLIVAVQGSLLSTVFFASGLCISIALTRHAGQFGRVYCADLAGAGLGTLLLAPLLRWCSAPAASFAVSAAGTAACGLCLPSKTAWRVRLVPLGASAAALAALCLNDSLRLPRVSAVKNYALRVLQTAEPPKVLEAWSAAGRVAVHPPRSNRYEREMMRVTIDGGAPTHLHRFAGDVAKLQYLRRDFRQIAQHLRGGGDLLVIGSAGGRDVRAGLAFDQHSITAVEIHPVTARLVTREYADYIGRIFQHPRVRFFNCEGRHYVARSRDQYDVIQIGMVDSWGGAGLRVQ